MCCFVFQNSSALSCTTPNNDIRNIPPATSTMHSTINSRKQAESTCKSCLHFWNKQNRDQGSYDACPPSQIVTTATFNFAKITALSQNKKDDIKTPSVGYIVHTKQSKTAQRLYTMCHCTSLYSIVKHSTSIVVFSIQEFST